MAERLLIVNADDFGRSEGVNRGIIEAHEHGIVTSASLMVRWPAAAEAALYARDRPELSVGLHLDFGEWAFRDEAWVALYEVVDIEDRESLAIEVQRQLAAFRQLMGTPPTHFDTHQHVHRQEPLASLLAQMGQDAGVPVRHFCPEITYCGSFYGQTGKGLPFPEGISLEGLLTLLAELPTGATELACHPGDGSALDTTYCAERAQEVRVLCDPRVRTALVEKGIRLCTFRQFARPVMGAAQ